QYTAVYFEERMVTGFGSGRGEALMFSGAHAVGAEIFDHLPEKESFSIVDEVYRRAPVAGVVDDDAWWFDIGTPQRYLDASTGFVGARSVVEGTLNNSVVWDDCRIGRGVVLNECIVASG